MLEEVAFAKALEGGAKSLEFTKLIHILAGEVKTLCRLEETVNVLNDPEESNTFLLELSSFLKELGCPYKKLVTGRQSNSLVKLLENCLIVLLFRISLPNLKYLGAKTSFLFTVFEHRGRIK